MKRLVLITMLAIPLSTQAALTGMTQESPCFNATVVSVIAMSARQSGEPLELMIKAYEEDSDLIPEIKSIIITILKFAYSVPIGATEKERDMEITKFANQAKAACLQERKTNNEKL